MKVVKVLFALALVSSFAACKPAACKKAKECCQAVTASVPAAAASCSAIENANNADQCTQVLNALKQMAQMTGTVPAACN
jgi:hypothetical protein